MGACAGPIRCSPQSFAIDVANVSNACRAGVSLQGIDVPRGYPAAANQPKGNGVHFTVSFVDGGFLLVH